nr:tetratricopeptide repeat protein 30A [Hymenolepis microstoma]
MMNRIKDGQCTLTIYGYLCMKRYSEAINILSYQRFNNPTSRAALSLLAYCYFHTHDFVQASNCFEQLSQLFPDNFTYRLQFAHCLHRAGLNDAALKIAASLISKITDSQLGDENFPRNQIQLLKLQAAICFDIGDIPGASSFIQQCADDDPDIIINTGCLLYQEDKYKEACALFLKALSIVEFQPTLVYYIALCYYKMKLYTQALKHIADIIEHGIHTHPELGVGMITEGVEVRSVGNTTTLRETALVEAFNLKAAIEFNLGNMTSAREALTDMPPRSEKELDHISLHNQAVISDMALTPTNGFHKLHFLLQQPVFPKETFANLLLLYIRYHYFDLAADLVAENNELAHKCLTFELLEFIEAVIMSQDAPEEAYQRLDKMASRYTERLHHLTKRIKEAKKGMDKDTLKLALNEYESDLGRYIPILMQQAKIYWDAKNYRQVEKILRKSAEFCKENETWMLNLAHVLFMLQLQNEEEEGVLYGYASSFYEPIVRGHFESLLDVSAIVVANLCVAYIMAGENTDAERLIRKLGEEEEAAAYNNEEEIGERKIKLFHTCIVNLVIGTLYCTRGNYDFGITRVIRSLEPCQKKLCTDTWYYAKRCFLSMIENLAAHTIMVKDSVLLDCIEFLEHCEIYGRNARVVVDQPLEGDQGHSGQDTIIFEARLLKFLLLKIFNN